jgi:uncharacterized protein (TIGR02300 family)
MIKPEWGTKRSCPKCGTRFYDLGKDDPVNCISCGVNFQPEAILKSKQPLPFEVVKADVVKKDADEDLGADLDIEADDDEPSADEEVDLGGDDDLGVNTNDGEEEH